MRSMQNEKIRELMDTPEHIRNISIIAHVDHGKTTLTDSLLAHAGVISENQAGKVCGLDFDPREQEMGITIKSTGMSVYYKNAVTEKESVVNLIDCPGHIDFSGEVTAALRITDGAVVVVDAVEGTAVQTETVLRQACQERIRPILVLNKLDRLFGELHEDSESVYMRLEKIIAKVNDIVSTHSSEERRNEFFLHPSKGNVIFASGKQCWGLSLLNFARIYSKRIPNATEQSLMQRLWGENYFSAKSKCFLEDRPEDNTPRSFVEFVLSPLQRLYEAASSGDAEKISTMVEKLGLSTQLPAKEIEKLKTISPQERIKKVMKTWLPLSETLLEAIQNHLPSPADAMKYRAEYLYTGETSEDTVLTQMQNNDPNGELMIFVSKMVPTADSSRFYALGRVFSGTLLHGTKVKVLDENYKPGTKEGCVYATVSRTYLMMGKQVESVESVPAGGIALILGVDHALNKTGTITTSEGAHCIRPLKHAISPIVRVAVSCKKQQELPRLIEALRMLKKYDPLVEVSSDENTGEYIVAGGGELHVQICLEKLREFAGGNAEIVSSPPRVQFRESVSAVSTQTCLSRTANSLNRLFGTCQPLGEELSNALSDNAFDIHQPESLSTVSQLVETFNWDREEAKRLWCFGPLDGSAPSNAFVNLTQAVQNLQAIKPSIITAFHWSAKEGLLCDEPLHGVRFNLTDAAVHTDPAHYRSNQITPAARRLFRACQYISEPTILEPVFLAQIRVPHEVVGNVYTLLSKRRGVIFSEEQDDTVTLIEAYLPVTESFSFDQALKQATQGRAFPSLSFDHWQAVQGSPLDPDTSAGKIVAEVRTRKGLALRLPPLSNYLDKL